MSTTGLTAIGSINIGGLVGLDVDKVGVTIG
jgi:hypothetical protein